MHFFEDLQISAYENINPKDPDGLDVISVCPCFDFEDYVRIISTKLPLVRFSDGRFEIGPSIGLMFRTSWSRDHS